MNLPTDKYQRIALGIGSLVGLYVALIIIGNVGERLSGSSAEASSHRSASNAHLPPAAKAADARAKIAIKRALKLIAADYQLWGEYDLADPWILGNEDHRLRKVSTLAADGKGKTFSVSVRSSSGTTFTVRGRGLRLTRTCAPVGPGCRGGKWSGATRLAVPEIPVVTSAEKAKIRQILTASVDHYAHLLSLGKQALGSTQYSSGMAGLAAFDDPNSAASRFRDYREKSKPDTDISMMDAFNQADSFYTAANEPDSIAVWRDDMGDVSTALSQWVTLAVGWQIREHTTAQLHALERNVELALAKARRDIDNVVAGR